MYPNKFIQSFDKAKIFYRYEKGKTPTLVFIHGGGVNSLCWKHQFEYFKQKKYSLLILDLRGHGRSKGKRKANNFKNYAKDLELILQKENIKNIILIGHSMGGLISLEYYHLFPKRIKSIILLASLPTVKLSRIKSLKRILEFYLRVKRSKKYNKKYPREMFHPSLTTIVKYHSAIRKFSGEKILNEIKVPVLVLAAKNDEFFSPNQLKESARSIKNSTFKTLPGRHIFIMQEYKIINNEIKIFIEKNRNI